MGFNGFAVGCLDKAISKEQTKKKLCRLLRMILLEFAFDLKSSPSLYSYY